MLREAIDIIRSLHTGGWSITGASTSRSTRHGCGTSPRCRSTSASPSRASAIAAFALLGDHLIGVEPESSLVDGWNAVDGAPRIGDGAGTSARSRSAGTPTRTRRSRGHEQFRWFGGGWQVNADLPTPAGFSGDAVRRPEGRRGLHHPVRARPGHDRRVGVGVLEGRLHRRRDRAGRRRRPGPLPRRGRPPAAREASRRLVVGSSRDFRRSSRDFWSTGRPEVSTHRDGTLDSTRGKSRPTVLRIGAAGLAAQRRAGRGRGRDLDLRYDGEQDDALSGGPGPWRHDPPPWAIVVSKAHSSRAPPGRRR